MDILTYYQTGKIIDDRVIDVEDIPFIRKYEEASTRYNKDPDQFADDQANDMVVHMLGYIDGKEEIFSRYFFTADAHHSLMHNKFWQKITGLLGEPTILDFPDKPAVVQHIFTANDKAVLSLIARTDYSVEGIPCGINYEAALVPRVDLKTLGNVATSAAMQ